MRLSETRGRPKKKTWIASVIFDFRRLELIGDVAPKGFFVMVRVLSWTLNLQNISCWIFVSGFVS